MVSPKKKLCMILPKHWEVLMGGSQYQAKCIIDLLKPYKKFDIYYLAKRIDTKFKPDGYRIVKIADCGWLSRLGYFGDAVPFLRALERIKPDVIYQRVACAYTGLAAFYARRRNCKMIWQIASDIDVSPRSHLGSQNPLGRYIEKTLIEYGIKHADVIIAQTKLQDEMLHMHYGRQANAVIPNFHPAPEQDIKKSDPVTVVWIANLKPVKRPESFVRLARELAGESGIRFVMVGAPYGDERKQRKFISESQGLVNFEYFGECSQEKVNELLCGAHLLVNTSLTEGFPNTFIQAWLRKVPVVSLDVNPGGILSSEEVGLFCHGSFGEMCDAVARLSSDAKLRSKLGGKAMKYALKHHSPKNAQDLIALFDV